MVYQFFIMIMMDNRQMDMLSLSLSPNTQELSLNESKKIWENTIYVD